MPQPSIIADSLKKDSVAKSLLPKKNYEHIFTAHILKPSHKEAIPFVDPTPVWPAFVLLLPVAMLVYLRVTYSKKIGPVFKSFFTLHAARQLEREDYRLTRRTSVILSFVFLSSLSFFLYQYNLHFPLIKMKWEPIIQFHAIFLFIVLIYLIKFISNMFLGFIIDAPNEVYEYNFNIFLGNQATGLFLLPVAVCMQYLKYAILPMVVSGFAIILLFYFLRLGKGIQIGMESRNFSTFHLFLYLCALEILPLIVLVTFLMRLNA